MSDLMKWSLLTYNVNFVYARQQQDPNCAKIIRGIKEADTSIVVLQETHEGFELYFRQELTELYPHQIYYHHKAAGGQAFLSKFPLEEIRTLDVPANVPGSWFAIHIVKVVIASDTQITLANVHLRPPLNDNGSANLFTARNTNRYRLAEVQYLAKEMNWSTPTATIITGDFNEHESSPGICWLKNTLKFVDGVETFVHPSRETHQWRIFYGCWLLKKRLDHILFSPDLICENCYVIDGYEEGASDHQPVKALFQ